MASRYEMEVKILSARDLKNINWRYGGLKPYAVVWINSNDKSSTKVDAGADASPYWDETLVVQFSSPIKDSTLYIDVVHAVAAGEDTKPLIGSAKLHLSDVVDNVGLDERSHRTLKLRRPSGRPQGMVEIKVTVRELRYRSSDSFHAPPYVVPPPSQPYVAPYSAPLPPPQPYAASYSAPPPVQPYAAPYSALSPPQPYYSTAPPPAAMYGYSNYGQASFGQPNYAQPAVGDQKKSKFGMGTGLAIGAVAGVLGGLVIGEGIEHLENKIADDVAERVEENLDDEYF